MFHPVMLWLLSLLLSLASASAIAAQALVTPTELAAKLGDSRLHIVDIREDKIDGKSTYELGHIAGAQHAPYAKWHGPAESPGKLPTADALTALIQRLGIDRTTPVIVVYEGMDSTDFGSAARVYWTLKAAGVSTLSVLNGGMTAWRAAGLPVSTETSVRAPSSFQVMLDPRLIATRDEVAQAVSNRSARLLDTRPAAYFAGQTRHAVAKKPGTIVGAKNVSHEVWFTKDGQLLPTDDIKQVAQQAGVWSETMSAQPTISFCNTGHWAATSWFVLSELLGHDDVKLYPESVVGWSNAGLAMENVPNRLQQFWLQLRVASGSP
ncbi:MAG: sulfurtransferase [Burkholderiaceae bacterium]